MSSFLTRKLFVFACAALFSGSFALAADSAADAARVSRQIDSDLQRSADDFNRELRDAYNTGNSAEIERQMDASISKANAELRRAAIRDNYSESRLELERNRSLYYPDSDGYQRYTRQIEELDRKFAAGEDRL